MPFVPVNDCVQIRLFFTSTAFHGGKPMVSCYLRDLTQTRDFAYLTAVAEAYRDDFWVGEMRGIASDNLRLDRIVVQDVEEEDGLQVELDVAQLGLVATPVLPANVAALAIWRAAESGPPRRGYTYWPGLVEAHVDFNSMSATGAIAWQGVAQVFKETAAVVNPATGAMVIASKFSGSTLQPAEPNGTRRRTPTPREVALTNTVQDPTIRSAISHQDRRVSPA